MYEKVIVSLPAKPYTYEAEWILWNNNNNNDNMIERLH